MGGCGSGVGGEVGVVEGVVRLEGSGDACIKKCVMTDNIEGNLSMMRRESEAIFRPLIYEIST